MVKGLGLTLCVPRRRCPVIPLSLRLKLESELQVFSGVLTLVATRVHARSVRCARRLGVAGRVNLEPVVQTLFCLVLLCRAMLYSTRVRVRVKVDP